MNTDKDEVLLAAAISLKQAAQDLIKKPSNSGIELYIKNSVTLISELQDRLRAADDELHKLAETNADLNLKLESLQSIIDEAQGQEPYGYEVDGIGLVRRKPDDSYRSKSLPLYANPLILDDNHFVKANKMVEKVNPQCNVPDGWQLVPKKIPMPSEMRTVLTNYYCDRHGKTFDELWADLLSSVPEVSHHE